MTQNCLAFLDRPFGQRDSDRCPEPALPGYRFCATHRCRADGCDTWGTGRNGCCPSHREAYCHAGCGAAVQAEGEGGDRPFGRDSGWQYDRYCDACNPLGPRPVEVPGTVTGYVYAIRGVDGGPTKLGFATSLVGRLEGNQTGNPAQLRIVWSAHCEMVVVEALLHRHFAAKRIRGEWFDLDDVDLASLTAILTAPVGVLGECHARNCPEPATEPNVHTAYCATHQALSVLSRAGKAVCDICGVANEKIVVAGPDGKEYSCDSVRFSPAAGGRVLCQHHYEEARQAAIAIAYPK